MENEVLTLIMVGSMAGLLALGVPFAFAMGGVGIVFGFIMMGPSVFSYVIFRMFDIMTNFTAITLPLFVFMATMISKSGVAEDLLTTFLSMGGFGPRVLGGRDSICVCVDWRHGWHCWR